ERLQRHGVADDTVAALDPACTPGLQGRVKTLLALRAGGGARAAGGHDQRRMDRAAFAPVGESSDELRRRSGAVGEHDHVSGHGLLPSVGTVGADPTLPREGDVDYESGATGNIDRVPGLGLAPHE